jgi:hypothetical protein
MNGHHMTSFEKIKPKTLGLCPKQFRLFALQKTESRRDFKNCFTIFETTTL